ncbi:MAG: glycosyltransferase family 2 protein [Actinobacteria bacterium]|nr:glycosyltransferase family 2 protein [Actinomycetota bacterium]
MWEPAPPQTPLGDGGRRAPSEERGEVELSVVVPVYGCEGCLQTLHDRLQATLSRITGSFEVVLVDDRSPDGAWQTIVELARRDHSVRGFRLSRNFGQHAAITAGLAQSRGRWTVVMDCDLQEPPEVIPHLYAKAQEGYDIVYTRRTGTPGSRLRAAAGRTYMRLRRFVLRTGGATNAGTLSMVSRKVVDSFLTLRDKDREYLIALEWLGFRHTTIEVERAARYEGRSSYTPGRLLQVAVAGMFFQTTILLRWIVFAGFFVALAGVLLAVYFFYTYFTSTPLPGYTSLAVLLLLLSGFIIVSMGVIGLYVGKVFEQVKGRPLFLVDREVIGGTESDAIRQVTDDVAAQPLVLEEASQALAAPPRPPR